MITRYVEAADLDAAKEQAGSQITARRKYRLRWIGKGQQDEGRYSMSQTCE